MNIKVIMTFITEISRATIGHGIFSTQCHHSLSPHTYSSAYIHRNSRNCCVTTFITGRNIQGHAQQEARAPLFYAIIFLRCVYMLLWNIIILFVLCNYLPPVCLHVVVEHHQLFVLCNYLPQVCTVEHVLEHEYTLCFTQLSPQVCAYVAYVEHDHSLCFAQ